MKMLLKIWTDNNKLIQKYYSDRTRRFSSNVVPNSFKKAQLKVLYGKRECSSGCICLFSNFGEYFNKTELLQAIKDFKES